MGAPTTLESSSRVAQISHNRHSNRERGSHHALVQYKLIPDVEAHSIWQSLPLKGCAAIVRQTLKKKTVRVIATSHAAYTKRWC